MSFANTNRRTFRGQGAPRDGNIPHSLSRRSRTARRDARDRSNQLAREARLLSSARDDIGMEDGLHAAANDSNGSEIGEAMSIDQLSRDFENIESTHHTSISAETQKEITHIKKRIRNVQESIQLSQAIVNPKTWEHEFLNAVANCVNEWKSIVSFHFHGWDGQEEGNNVWREVQLSVFGLVQMVLQSGPLTGSNPGYFKRCGGDVAKTALNFLTSSGFEGDLSQTLLFTEKQISAISKWTKNAEKAAANDKPASKSMIKLQQGKGKSRTKNEKARRKK